MLHPSQTIWLSLEAVVVRILQLYESLKIYFFFAAYIDDIDNAKDILKNLNDVNELYFCFLKYILNFINNINKSFQSENIQIHNMYNDTKKFFKTVLSNFIEEDYIKNSALNNIIFDDQEQFLKKEEIYVGVYVKEKISQYEINIEEYKNFIDNCLFFYIELCFQIKKRFDFGITIINNLYLMNPLTILNKKTLFYHCKKVFLIWFKRKIIKKLKMN